jgi:hypothetical protein
MTGRPAITRLDVGEFTFPADEPWPGETGVVVAYLVRHPDGIVLFDTGLGVGESELDERYHPGPDRSRPSSRSGSGTIARRGSGAEPRPIGGSRYPRW